MLAGTTPYWPAIQSEIDENSFSEVTATTTRELESPKSKLTDLITKKEKSKELSFPRYMLFFIDGNFRLSIRLL